MDLAFHDLFTEIAVILAIATLGGFIGQQLRQPLIVSFIAVGILCGPDVLGVVRTMDPIELLAEIGIAVLLFLVGLKLDVQLVTKLGRVAVATGLGQIVFTTVIGLAICLAIGLDLVTSLYVSVALTFSSTIIIVKLLSDKRELDSLHGRIALGFLIVQDLFVILAMVFLSALGIGTAESGGLGDVALTLASGVLLIAAVGLFIRYAAEPIMRRLARTPELLVVFGITWAVLLAAAGDILGFGKELGGLLAGVSIASTVYREAIASRLASLRDFLLLFFFIGLGAKLDLGVLGDQVPAAITLSLFVLVGNPLIVLVIMGAMGYRARTGFMAGLTVAQISEFSLIFIAMGMTLGHVDAAAIGLVTLVGLVTITLSTYMITYAQPLYAALEPLLLLAERKVAFAEERETATPAAKGAYDIIVYGLGRLGREVALGLREAGNTVLSVDFDPEAVRRWRLRNLPAVYGDAGDPEFPGTLPLAGVRWVVVAIRPQETGVTHNDFRLVLMDAFRAAGYRGEFAVTCQEGLDARAMLRAGATLVLTPFSDAASRAVERILEVDVARRQVEGGAVPTVTPVGADG